MPTRDAPDAARRRRSRWRSTAQRAGRARAALGSGSRVIGVWRAAVGRTLGRDRSPLPARRRGSRATSGRSCARRRRSAPDGRAQPAHRGPVRPEGGARQHGRDLRPARGPRDVGRGARGERRARSRWCPGAGTPLRELAAASARRCSCSAPSAPACRPRSSPPATRSPTFPVAGADSLNVAMTATLCLYEYRRAPQA